VLQRAAGLGFSAAAAAEFEFFVFNETPASVRAKSYRGLTNLTPGYFGYSMLRTSVQAELYQALLQLAEDMRMPIEGLHAETGPGVIEAALHYTEALEAADRAALFKTFVKVLAQRRGLMATFMAKWSQQLPGQSGHLHLSLTRGDGSAVFYDEQAAYDVGRAALVRGRPAGADAGASGNGGVHGEQLLAPGAGLLGAHGRDLGRGKSHLRAAGDSGGREEPAGGISHRRGRHQSLPGDCGRDRFRPVGHRAQDRTR
jgi:hypothetical protein